MNGTPMSSILIVDDDSDIAALLTASLENAGHNVRHAHDGLAGLEEVNKAFPDLIFPVPEPSAAARSA